MKQLSFGQTLRLIQAESRGAGRRFVFFVLCLAIGVGAVMMIKSFGNLLERSIQRESKGLLSADIEIRSSWEQNEKDRAFQKKILPEGTRFVFIKELHAMAQFSREAAAPEPGCSASNPPPRAPSRRSPSSAPPGQNRARCVSTPW